MQILISGLVLPDLYGALRFETELKLEHVKFLVNFDLLLRCMPCDIIPAYAQMVTANEWYEV